MPLANITTTREPKDFSEKAMLTHCVVHKTSFMCAMDRGADLPLMVYLDGDRWFLGARYTIRDERNNTPSEVLLRDSEYFDTEEGARAALENRSWCQRMYPP